MIMRSSYISVVLLLYAVLVTTLKPMPVHAATGPSPVSGDWMGKLSLGNGEYLRIGITVVDSAAGGLIGRLASPDQGPGTVALDSVTLTGNTFTFRSAAIDASYKGILSASRNSIVGTFTQHGIPLSLNFLPQSESEAKGLVISDSDAREIVGTWQGRLNLGNGSSLRIVFTFSRSSDRYLTGTMASPDQSSQTAPVQVRFKSGSIDITVPLNGGSYHGTLASDLQAIHGSWTQNGASLALNLTKTDQAAAPDRPQTPKTPYPYSSIEVGFPNAEAGIQLAGTLTEPPGPGPFPAAVLIGGSGPNDRDETIFGHRPFLVLADYLTRRGIAVLRYDKRGVGESSGKFDSATSVDFAGDSLAAVAFMKSRSEIEASHIGLIGHSEGGMIAPMCAARSADVSYTVLLAGDGLRGDKLLESQIQSLSTVEGGRPGYISTFQKFIKTEYEILTAGYNESTTTAKLGRAVLESGLPVGVAAPFATRWFRYVIVYDPAVTLRKVKCPVLALDGSLDLQVDAKENLPAIGAALKAGGNTDYSVRELPGLNHLFQPARTGSPIEYERISTTIDPSVLTIVGDWITAHVKEQAGTVPISTQHL